MMDINEAVNELKEIMAGTTYTNLLRSIESFAGDEPVETTPDNWIALTDIVLDEVSMLDESSLQLDIDIMNIISSLEL